MSKPGDKIRQYKIDKINFICLEKAILLGISHKEKNINKQTELIQ